MPLKRENSRRVGESNTCDGLVTVGIFLITLGVIGFLLVGAEINKINELEETLEGSPELDLWNYATYYQFALQIALIGSGAAFIKIGTQENIWPETGAKATDRRTTRSEETEMNPEEVHTSIAILVGLFLVVTILFFLFVMV